MTDTLAIDCGGSGIKGSVLDFEGAMRVPRVRIATPYPLPPDRFVEALRTVARDLPDFARVTVGMPGMIRHGVVVQTPHYVTRSGPRSRPHPELVTAWGQFDAATAVGQAFDRPALVLNDAEVHGAGCVSGVGLEVMLTLGTGLGCAMFDRGQLAPHLEMSHAPVRRSATFDTYIGDTERRRLGDARWSRRVVKAVEALRPVFVWDRLYLGGGNAKRIAPADRERLGQSVEIVPNSVGILGGVRAWSLKMQ
jgi:polyphosphate glucokinase